MKIFSPASVGLFFCTTITPKKIPIPHSLTETTSTPKALPPANK